MITAVFGVTALWLFYGWLGVTIACSHLSRRKGYGDRPGLACGLLLYPVGLLLWRVWPARPDSEWKRVGPRPRQGPGRGSTGAG
jgi:hypothetical protein